jgi:magnesium-transporting ATPase (P-type)
MGKKTQPSLEGHVPGQSNKPLSKPAHALPFSQVVEETGCSPENGLTPSEAKTRHEEYGNNDLGEDGGVQPGKILLRQVANAMTLVTCSNTQSKMSVLIMYRSSF